MVVLTLGIDAHDDTGWAPPGATVIALDDPAHHLTDDLPDSAAIVLAIRDRVHLRRAVTVLPDLGRTHWVGCWIAQPAGRPPSLVPRGEWPPLAGLQVSCASSGFLLAEFVRPVAARRVLIDVARHSTSQRLLAPGWPVLGALVTEPDRWPGGDPAAVIVADVDAAVHPEDPRIPPDVVLVRRGGGEPARAGDEPSPITGRTPVVVGVEPDLSWDRFESLPAGERQELAERAGPVSLGGIDEQVLNPVGFTARWRHPVTTLAPHDTHQHLLRVEVGRDARDIDTRHGLNDDDVRALRGTQGLRLTWQGGVGPTSYARLVAALATAGVPLSADTVPAWAGAFLGSGLAAELTRPVELDDPLAREESSLRLRRLALRAHSSRAWRSALATSAGVPGRPRPTVSVLLSTRRPEMVAFILEQLSRQQGVQLEVVLATHGFTPDAATMAAVAPDVSLVVTPAPASLPFGEVLNLAASRASGTHLLKMDDDDWYGPHFVEDLLLAQGYSNGDVVGAPPEFVYLEEVDRTVRHRYPTEVYRDFVAGGTLLMSRGVFNEVGGFRSTRKYVDAAVLAAVRNAGGSVYRTHGLGYVLRRRDGGHTWDAGLEYFTDPERVSGQWDGFRPSEAVRAPAG